MKYYKKNDIHFIQCSPEEFSISICDKPKKNIDESTYVNAGFFATYKENGVKFTLPVGNIIADLDTNEKHINKYLKERGQIKNNKAYFDSYSWSYSNQFYKKNLTTFFIKNGKPQIKDISILDKNCDYAIAGTPIIRDSKDVKFKTYVKPMGWDGSTLYGTKRIMIGLKPNDSNIYIMGWKSNTSNCIYSGETWTKLKNFGFCDVIALDGGGSYHYEVNDKVVDTMTENRQINSIIIIKNITDKIINNSTTNQSVQTTTTISSINPYKCPTTSLKQGSSGEGVKWIQWQLKNKANIVCDIDGQFGPATKKAVIEFQGKNSLDKDGSVGPLTRSALKQLK